MPCNEIKQILKDGGALLDVRSPQEFAGGALPGAQNVPLNGINNALQSLPKDQPVLLYCRSGARSGMAQRFLLQEGFDAHNIGSYNRFTHC
jgi:phage shock protein E